MRKVRYSKALTPIIVGQSAVVIPLDHPDRDRVSNNRPCLTTEVQGVASDGTTFITRNSEYVLETVEEADQRIAAEFP